LASMCSRCGAAERYSTSSYCQPCHKEYQRGWYAKNRERKDEQNRAWKETHREAYREQQRAASLARYRRDPDKARATSQAYREQNPEKVKAQYKRWHQENPQKARDKHQRYVARRRGAERVEKIDRRYVYERDGGKCHICCRSVSSKRFSLDHLVPLSRGGNHTLDNVRLAHIPCNSRRGPGRLPAQLLLVA
jgi:5-methylcytosine-specific restriction endonuclease McrA